MIGILWLNQFIGLFIINNFMDNSLLSKQEQVSSEDQNELYNSQGVKQLKITSLNSNYSQQSDSENKQIGLRYERELMLSCKTLFSQLELDQLFNNKHISYNPRSFQSDLAITIQEVTANYQIIKLIAHYGYFAVTLNIINVDTQSRLQRLQEKFSGGFGDIYRINQQKNWIALKSLKFKEERFASIFRQAIKEYFLLMVASALRIGPKVIKVFGFDIVVYRESLCFSMEFCDMGYYAVGGIEQELRAKLHLLHSLNIVHMDIKPENIAFSPHFGEYVFIDFGLSKAIKEPIGAKTLTSFTGSFEFCSQEMLQLYTKDTSGQIDLYFNDAYCLNKCLNHLRKTEEEHVGEDYFVLHKSPLWFLKHVSLIKLKMALYQLSYSFYSNSPILSRLKYLTVQNRLQLAKFISTLPQSDHLLQFNRLQLQPYENVETKPVNDLMIHKVLTDRDNIPLSFIDRFDKIEGINNGSQSGPSNHYLTANFHILFDRDIQSTINPLIHALVLMRFIKISNVSIKFDEKLAACRLFWQRHTDHYQYKSEKELYKGTIKYVFESCFSTSCRQGMEILKNAIQTVIILQIVEEKAVLQAFKYILEKDTSFVQRMVVVLQFIFSLEFIKEKYKKSYNYNNLTEIFMVNLNDYMKKQQIQLKDYDEIQLANRIKFIIARKIGVDYGNYYIEDYQYIKKLKTVRLIDIHQAITNYLLYNELVFTLHRYSRVNSSYFNYMVTFINQITQHSHAFRYIHFSVFHISFRMNTLTLCNSIYSIFHEQFCHFQEHQYFEIYYLNELVALKNMLSSRLMVEREQISKALVDSTDSNYQSLFRTLDYIIQNNQDFHVYLGAFLNIATTRADKTCIDYVASLYRKYKPKLLTFTNFGHVSNKFTHISSLKMPIDNINKLFQYPIETYQDKIDILRQSRDKILAVLDQIDCFQCRVFALIELGFLQVNISGIDKSEESFGITIELLILHMKNFKLNAKIFPILWALISNWRHTPLLYQRYDLRQFYYDIMRQSGKFQNCLVDLRRYNIFLNLYINIAQFHREEDLTNFVFKVVEAIQKNKSNAFIDHFYYSVSYLVEINLKMEKNYQFIYYHQNVISNLLSIKQRKNAFLSLYYSALFKLNIRKDIALKVLIRISQSFNKISKHAKMLIIDQYYFYFIHYLSLSSRRQKYIFNRHLKYSLDKLKLKFILKAKLSRQMPSWKQHRIPRLIRQHIIRYYQVTGNIA